MKHQQPAAGFTESFEKVAQDEFLQIRSRRAQAWTEMDLPDDLGIAPPLPGEKREEQCLVGLALSGGGVRSATFGLGVIQGLAQLRLLPLIDYLSTVSGGGYIGSWLMAWIKRSGGEQQVRKRLSLTRGGRSPANHGLFSEHEPGPVLHLRRYSNYLSPKASIYSADSWTLFAIFLRGLVANQLVLLPAMLFVALFVRAIVFLFQWTAQIPQVYVWSIAASAGLLLATSFWCVLASLQRIGRFGPSVTTVNEEVPKTQTLGFVAVVLVFLSSVFLTWIFAPVTFSSGGLDPLAPVAWRLRGESAPEIQFSDWKSEHMLMFIGVLTAAHGLTGLYRALSDPPLSVNDDDAKLTQARRVLASTVAGAAAGLLLYVIVTQVLWNCSFGRLPSNPALTVAIGPPLMLLEFILATMVEVAVLGRRATELEREWWGRLNALCLIAAALWLVTCGLVVFGGLWFLQLGSAFKATLTVGWAASALTGYVAVRNAQTSAVRQSLTTRWAIRITPYLFLVGLVCAMSLLSARLIGFCRESLQTGRVDQFVNQLERTEIPARDLADHLVTVRTTTTGGHMVEEEIRESRFVRSREAIALERTRYWFDMRNPHAVCLLGTLVAVLLGAYVMSSLVDINEFSLNAMYANRLARCYLGATRGEASQHQARRDADPRTPDDLTGFDPNDDLSLTEFRIGKRPDSRLSRRRSLPVYWGPYPIINTALNLVSGDELAWQERKAESFFLSPLYSGSAKVGFADTSDLASTEIAEKQITLGRAVAISGAAANPNMGSRSTPAVTALMTLFNVRLGWWLPNPRHGAAWRTSGPRHLLLWIMKELLGRTSAAREFLNISDGGHFENLGVYELIRRRCRLIIVSDAGADPEFRYEDLGNLVRKCRNDFQIEIEIDSSAIQAASGPERERPHSVIGTIRYDLKDPSLRPGLLLYLKPTVTGDEPADVQQYAKEHPAFPHEPTSDQFFSESQFESYRALGFHTVQKALGSVAARLQHYQQLTLLGAGKEINAEFMTRVQEKHVGAVDNLVYLLGKLAESRISQPTPEFLKSVEGFVTLHRDFRELDSAAASRSLYPDLPARASQTDRRPKRGRPPRERRPAFPRNQLRVADDSRERTVDCGGDIHTACQMIQVMENAWLSLQLAESYDTSLNSGWMNLFQRWAQSSLVRRCWPILKSEFSRPFVSFCEQHTALKTRYGSFELLETLPQPDFRRLADEFRQEWQETDVSVSLDHYLQSAQVFNYFGPAKAAWFIRSELSPDAARDLPGPHLRPPVAVGFLVPTKAPAEIVDQLQWQNCDIFQFIVWVRPGYRQHRAGQTIVEEFLFGDASTTGCLEELNRQFPQRCLVTLWPKFGRFELTDARAVDRWARYFGFYGFQQFSLPWKDLGDQFHILTRRR